jgi:hypothetical protein
MWRVGPYSQACSIKANRGGNTMNTNLSAVIATERHERLISDASEYRRSASAKTPRRHRFAALVKDLAAASL